MRSALLAAILAAFAPNTQPVTVRFAAQNDSHETGTATLISTGSATQITIVMLGEPANAVQPANVHAGTCDAVAQILYPLRDVRNGRSKSSVNVSLSALQHGAYVIVIQNAPASLHAAKDYHYVSCAELP